MGRTVGRIVLDVVVTVVLSLLLLTVWRSMAGATAANSFGEAAQRLFLFMDVGLLVWVLMLMITALRRRPVGAGLALVFGAVGALANLLTVVLVGFAQQGGWAEQFILFAIEAGIAFLVAAVIAVLVVHRLILKPSPGPDSQP